MEGDQLDWKLPVPNGRHDGPRIAVRLAELPRSLRPPQHSLPRRMHSLSPFTAASPRPSSLSERIHGLRHLRISLHSPIPLPLHTRLRPFLPLRLPFRPLLLPRARLSAVFSPLLDDPYADSLRERGIDPSRPLRGRYGSHRGVSLLPHLREVPYAHIGGGSARNVPQGRAERRREHQQHGRIASVVSAEGGGRGGDSERSVDLEV